MKPRRRRPTARRALRAAREAQAPHGFRHGPEPARELVERARAEDDPAPEARADEEHPAK